MSKQSFTGSSRYTDYNNINNTRVATGKWKLYAAKINVVVKPFQTEEVKKFFFCISGYMPN